MTQFKPLWGFGVIWYVVFLLIGVLPPPTWPAVVLATPGLYWGMRGRNASFDGELSDIIPISLERGKEEGARSGSSASSGSVFSGVIWMSALSVLLFWLPFFGPLLAGFVGGKKAGSVVSGIVAAVLPAIATGGLLFLAGTALELPVIGAIVGGAAMLVVVTHSGILLVGAGVGGLLS
ncbi:hypothetical protein [Halopenitus persicus]|uniref:hypothetical protein n=1 Tax=Halopenitus persicus TaxID=1048396 RepID=UPI0018EEB94D|nr:hypothetical protein [Halopenitus persicus]